MFVHKFVFVLKPFFFVNSLKALINVFSVQVLFGPEIMLLNGTI